MSLAVIPSLDRPFPLSCIVLVFPTVPISLANPSRETPVPFRYTRCQPGTRAAQHFLIQPRQTAPRGLPPSWMTRWRDMKHAGRSICIAGGPVLAVRVPDCAASRDPKEPDIQVVLVFTAAPDGLPRPVERHPFRTDSLPPWSRKENADLGQIHPGRAWERYDAMPRCVVRTDPLRGAAVAGERVSGT